MSISLQGLILIVIAAALMSAGSLGLKGAITAVGGFGNNVGTIYKDIFALATNPIFIVGLILYGSGTLIWMRVIATEPLSIGYPILMGFAFIAITIGAVAFFQETVSPVKLLGMFVIIVGVIIASNG